MTSQTENILYGARDMTKCNILFKVSWLDDMYEEVMAEVRLRR